MTDLVSDAAAGAASPAAVPSAVESPMAPSVGIDLKAGGGISAGKDFNVIGRQQNTKVNVFSDADEESLFLPRDFTVSDAQPLPSHLRDELQNTFVARDGVIARLLQRAKDRRILLLTGPRNSGKRTAGLYLGLGLTSGESCTREPLVIESLERRVTLDLPAIAADQDNFGGRTTIFVNAFEQRNQQLKAFFSTGDVKWARLTETLTRSGAYLIFTATTASAPFLSRVTEYVAHYEWTTLDSHEPQSAFDRFVQWAAMQQSIAAEPVAALTSHRAAILSEFTTVPRLASFLRQFVRDDVDLETGLRRHRDGSFWFRTALERDLEGWTFVLTLALAQAAPDSSDVAWADFERLRAVLLERLRSDPVFFGRKKRSEDDEIDGRTLGDVFCDDGLFERCRAVVGKDASRLGDVVRFSHPSLKTDIWKTLLTHHRRVLMSLLPVLRRVAETDTEWSVRSLAAQIIGRIGELDPARITLSLMRQWTESDDGATNALVGRAAQGALGSESEPYKSAVLRYVESLCDVRGSSEESVQQRLLTAIAACAQIGPHEPARAMEWLGNIVIDYLVPRLADVHEVARAAEVAQAEETTAMTRRSALRQRRVRLSRLAGELFAEHAPVVIALEQTVVTLCLLDDAIRILRLMCDWSVRGGTQARSMLAFLFLKDGIADDLQGMPSGVRALTGLSGSPLLMSLVTGKDAVRTLTRFLLEIHHGLDDTELLPFVLRSDLQQRFWKCLAAWAAEAVANSDYREAVEELFFSLGTFQQSRLLPQLREALAVAPFDRGGLKAFARAVNDRLDRKQYKARSS